ncbi:unnamed protein product [Lactuca virosa]|uniref:Uncharacterized protein n=1 Tax=Lactuca virosa TaxID=75947 RepID=A0AAU9N108_9ASTR|nr:unnamed protein product [Lactuca virosa]
MSSSSTGSKTIASSWQNPHGDFRNRTTPWFCIDVVLKLAYQFPRQKRILEGNLGDAPTTRWVDPRLPNQDYKNLMFQMHLALVSMVDGNVSWNW